MGTDPDGKALIRVADAEVQHLLRRMPEALREPAAGVPVVYAEWPDEDLVAEGFDPDLLGLFSGTPFAEQESDPVALPPTITLFLRSIWEEAEGDETRFREEIRVTYLHEMGHYLGLDEDGLALRDLE